MEKSKIDLERAALNKSLEVVSKGVKCPFTGCSGIINTIDARACVRWHRLREADYGLPAGSWTFSISEPNRYTLTCSANLKHETTFKRDELPKDFQCFTYFGVHPYTPKLKRKVH